MKFCYTCDTNEDRCTCNQDVYGRPLGDNPVNLHENQPIATITIAYGCAHSKVYTAKRAGQDRTLDCWYGVCPDCQLRRINY